MVNYRELEYAVSHQDSYTHGSSHATWEHNSQTGDDTYKVWSYNTLMLTIVNDEIVFYNSKKYSTTTSRLQNIIKRCFNNEMLDKASE